MSQLISLAHKRTKKCEWKTTKKVIEYSLILFDPDHYHDTWFTLDQQYADDIGWVSTSQHVLDNIDKNYNRKLKQGNLHINQSKTEKYHIKKGREESLKKCYYRVCANMKIFMLIAWISLI